MTSTAGSFAISRLAGLQDAIEGLLSPRGRRLAVIAILLVTFVMVTASRVLNAIRLETIGIDLRIYRAAAEAALAGHDPWAASVDGLTFAAPPPTLLPYLPAAVLPEAIAMAFYAVLSVVAAIAVLRVLQLPLWWLLFPPISESLIVLNPDILVIGLLVATPRFAALAIPIKIYATVPLLLTMRWRPLLVGAGLCLLSAPWWSDFVAAGTSIQASLDVQSYGGASAWGTWLMVPTIAALAVVYRRGAEWLTVPAIWPYTQLHYSALALPVAARNAFVAFVLCFAVPFAAPVATIAYAVWVVIEPRVIAYRLGEENSEPSTLD